MIQQLVGFFAVLGFLIFIHELGHYLAARIAGVKVEEFGLGYPPRLARLFSFQGTDFTLNWIPYGGFARLKGTDEDDPEPDSFNAASPWHKILILGAGSAMNLLLAILCFSITYRAGVPISTGVPELITVPAASHAAAHRLQTGDILLGIDDQPAAITAIPDSIRLRAFSPEPDDAYIAEHLTVMRDGTLLQIPLANALTLTELLADTDYRSVLTARITGVADDSPAQHAGIQKDDRVYSLADIVIGQQTDVLVDEIRQHLDVKVPMVLLRQETEWVQTSVTPRSEPPPGQGALGVLLSPTSNIGYVRSSDAVAMGLRDTAGYIWATLSLPAQLIRGQAQPEDTSFVGPIGIAALVGDAIEVTSSTGLWLPVLRLTAVLSAALAIINLLPVPALDGGRILFVLIEVIRRKRIEPAREKVVHMVGMALLLLFMVLVTIQDLTMPQQSIDWYSILGR